MNDTEVAENTIPDELTTLKKRATSLGIKFHPNTGVDKLRTRVNNFLNDGTAGDEPAKPFTKQPGKTFSMMTHAEYSAEQAKATKRNTSRQVRIRLSCNNPNKKNDETVFISVGSAKLGTHKEYIPLDWEAGWHISNIVYEALKEKKYSKFYTVKGMHGKDVRKSKLVPEFVIAVLPPLTKAELKDLAQQQAIAAKD